MIPRIEVVIQATHLESSKWNRLGHRRYVSLRKGTATVELAVCLPILVTIVFGSIQACNMLYLKHALLSSAYQGSLAASKYGATTTSIEQSINSMLAARGVKNATVRIKPAQSDFSQYPKGQVCTIRVTAPVRANLMRPHLFIPPNRAVAEVVTMK